GEAAPGEILAVTFTNKAAREMSQRIVHLLSQLQVPVYEDLWVTTFHSCCARILRDQIHLLDYQPFFVIYDESDQLGVIKKVIKDLNLNDKIYTPKGLKARIQEAKNQGLGPDEVERKAPLLMNEKSLEVYRVYEEYLKRANALDFSDLLLKTYELFRLYPPVLEEYQNRFKYILIDEYQDTNHIQYLLVKLLAEKHHNLCVVGDEDQSIYSWRGADITNILSFEKDFPDCKVIKLEENYRSTQTIVKAASALIQNNTQRKGKVLFSQKEEGVKIHIREEASEYEEARYVVSQISSLRQEQPYAYKDFAVFYRTNAQSRVLEEQLRSYRIPYKLIGGLRFYDRMEVKNILAYMRLMLNLKDDAALKRIINVPGRGIGKTTLDKLQAEAHRSSLSLFETIPLMIEKKLVHSGTQKKLKSFYDLLTSLYEYSQRASLSEIYIQILEATQYVQRLKEENTLESKGRIENLEELNNAITQFESERGEEASLQSFLEEMALVSDADQVSENEDHVTLMTLHVSKGLEYPVVFIVGMEEGLFPSFQSMDESDPFSLEEERRLAYVGMTRAKERLFLTHARTRRVWGQEQTYAPSLFLKELPENLVTRSSSLGRPRFLTRYQKKYSPSVEEEISQFMPDYEDFSDEEIGFQKGMRVRHPTFGVGSVLKVEGKGENQKVSVLFRNQTSKKFIAKYARLERV
ncbi:MAG: ATP-dependent DNA helicase, partial [Bdellovibrio sp.]